MNFRQVHLDCHTSEKIANIGSGFSKKQFQDALKRGHVNSITLFSKCHHGWAYHPSVANEMHPHLNFDLLAAQIEAAHEIGVKTPVYLSAGLDEKMARRHPDWLRYDNPECAISWNKPFYREFCMNSPYLEYLAQQIEEVVKNYDCDGIFLDIVGVRTCYCQHCVQTLLDEGKDPYDENNVKELGERVYKRYYERCREAVDKYKPGLPIFHNGGHIRHGRRDLVFANTHLELESLPTGDWGYDHFPLSAAYTRTLSMEFLGMTGKFHTYWGEFGGFKHPNALRYEAALSIANGAKCSIGDQMHPDGHLEEATYDLIGAAYSEVEALEPWLEGVTAVTDIAVLSEEAYGSYHGGDENRNAKTDSGVVRIMLEGKFLFDIIDTQSLLEGLNNKYKLLILPDCIRLDEKLTRAIKNFITKGGKVLATGESGVNENNEFALDFGCNFKGKSEYQPTYIRPNFDLQVLGNTAFVIYEPTYNIEMTNGTVLAERQDPYFNRSTFNFSSHQHTPNNKSNSAPAISIGKDGAYIASKIFTEYATMGSLIAKLIAVNVINKLLDDNKTVTTSLPAQGIVTLMNQIEKNRLICHLLYTSPIKRGQGIEVIEDIVPLYNVESSIKLDKEPKKVYLAPSIEPVEYSYKNGKLSFVLKKLDMHAPVVIEF